MHPSRPHCICASLAVAVLLLAPRTFAENLTIASSPVGATVEINGVVACKTPCQLKYPGGYFHKTKTLFGSRLLHGLTARVCKDGYTVQEISLTEGPREWTSLNGRDHGRYRLFKTNHIEITLEPTSAAPSKRQGTDENAGSGVVAVMSDAPGAGFTSMRDSWGKRRRQFGCRAGCTTSK
jgi:hypothetical protein